MPTTALEPPLLLNVDDAEAIRYAKTRTLQRAGYAIIEASTGREALARVAADRPALVLLDVKLPDINGIEVCRIIKQEHPSTLVLQLSAAFVSTADRVAGLESGADSYLIQPVEPDELTAAVGALLRLHKAEDALRRANETLEQRVLERTRELAEANRQLRTEIEERERAEAALRQSQKMEAVGQLTGGIAHDFNNHIMAITGNLEILQQRLAQGRTDVQSLAENAMKGAERAAAVTQRLLAFSRRQPLAPRRLDANALVRNMGDLIRQTVGQAIAVECRLQDGLWPVWCDANQLENALLNLVINARDAMPSGGRLMIETSNVEIDATAARPDLAPGAYVEIRIEDTGVGMTPDVLQQAFDPFFTTKPAGQGTGLGLSMLYGFVKQSGGHVEIESAPGRGASIRILLLRAPGGADEPGHIQTPPGSVERGCGETILLVEDEPPIRMLMTQTLTDQGYVCIEAQDANEALRLLGSAAVDLLVTDVGLPGMDGRRLAEGARSVHPDLKIMFTTGHAHEFCNNFSASNGVILLKKPFSMTEFAQSVRDLLNGG